MTLYVPAYVTSDHGAVRRPFNVAASTIEEAVTLARARVTDKPDYRLVQLTVAATGAVAWPRGCESNT